MRVLDTVTGVVLESENPETLSQWSKHSLRYSPVLNGEREKENRPTRKQRKPEKERRV